jgi:hypothetical protein
MESLQLLAEVRFLGLQVPHRSHNHRRFGGDVQHPLVILEPWTGFHLNGAHNSLTLGHLQVSLRQGRLVELCIVLGRPRDTLRAPRVEKVDVGIDDGYGRGSRAHVDVD